ncbi:hydroxyisourate hydrolase [Georgenia yuyongxinii]
MTSHVTTHVLDAVAGVPAAGVGLTLLRHAGGELTEVAAGHTDADGRAGELGPASLEPGTYRIVFATGEYFSALGRPAFYPEVTIDFRVEAGRPHDHVPLLLSPFAYSTYRGS